VFTITHHFIIYFCAKLNGIKTFKDYIILGDDIVIKNSNVAKTYIEVMNELGVEVSVPKTHVSNDTYEFAKRWIQPFRSVKEITGIPLKGIISNLKNPQIVYTILYDYFKIKKNLYLGKDSLVKMISHLYKSIYILERTKKKTLKKK
jgi:hypothetical protein